MIKILLCSYTIKDHTPVTYGFRGFLFFRGRQEKKIELNRTVEQESLAEKILYGILTQIELWANKTFEGQKKTFGVVLCKDMMSPDENPFDYFDFLKNDYSATINDGIYSAVELFSNGFFKEDLTIKNDVGKNLSSIPYPFSGFANLCTEDKIGILLTESGLETPENASAIYQAVVDVSYSRGGACIGIINQDQLPNKLYDKIKAGLFR